jgi:hypothetical protein
VERVIEEGDGYLVIEKRDVGHVHDVVERG